MKKIFVILAVAIGSFSWQHAAAQLANAQIPQLFLPFAYYNNVAHEIERKIASSRLSAYSSLQQAKQKYAHAGSNAAGIASGQ